MSHQESPKLLSFAVHEFRSPTTVVAGYLRMLLKHFSETIPEPQRKLLEEAEKSCKRLTDLLADMSEYAHLRAGDTTLTSEPVRVFEVLADVAKGVHEGQDRGLALKLIVTGSEAIVTGDGARLRQAFSAVLTATLREHVQPGTITVRGRIERSPGNGAFAVILIGEDAVDGAPTTFDESCWQSFQELRGGMGFALPMARAVIEAAGGHIYSSREASRRAAVLVKLPLKE